MSFELDDRNNEVNRLREEADNESQCMTINYLQSNIEHDHEVKIEVNGYEFDNLSDAEKNIGNHLKNLTIKIGSLSSYISLNNFRLSLVISTSHLELSHEIKSYFIKLRNRNKYQRALSSFTALFSALILFTVTLWLLKSEFVKDSPYTSLSLFLISALSLTLIILISVRNYFYKVRVIGSSPEKHWSSISSMKFKDLIEKSIYVFVGIAIKSGWDYISS